MNKDILKCFFIDKDFYFFSFIINFSKIIRNFKMKPTQSSFSDLYLDCMSYIKSGYFNIF